MDVSLPGMLYGFINRAPVNGASPKLLNESFIRSIEGVEQVIKLDHGIGILVTSIEVGLKTKLQLQIESSETKVTTHNSEADMADYENADGNEKIVVNEGKVDDEMLNAATTYQANSTNAYVYHAQMEPLNAVVSVSKDKKSAELWIGSQSPDGAKSAVAKKLGIQISEVTVNQLYLGGGFGRRSMADYASECAALAKTTEQPVKLIWTREDDIQYGAFRPQCLQQLKAGVNRKGMITAWSHKSIGPGGGLLGGSDMSHYVIPNKTFILKSIDHGAGKFAIEAFIDQIARAQNRDPYAYRVELMSQDDKARKVLEKVGQISNWKSARENGKGRGIAFADRDSYTAGVAEISVDRNTGVIKVHKFWVAIDAGVIVQPDNATAQIEGAITMGISSALKEQITFKSGKVEQSNFHDYPILRMSESPDSIEVAFIESTNAPTGMGEAALPLVGGSIASAFAALTGKYLYNMPFTPERVLEVLKA